MTLKERLVAEAEAIEARKEAEKTREDQRYREVGTSGFLALSGKLEDNMWWVAASRQYILAFPHYMDDLRSREAFVEAAVAWAKENGLNAQNCGTGVRFAW